MDGRKSNWRSKGSYASCPALFDKVSVWSVLFSQTGSVALYIAGRGYREAVRVCVCMNRMLVDASSSKECRFRLHGGLG